MSLVIFNNENILISPHNLNPLFLNLISASQNISNTFFNDNLSFIKYDNTVISVFTSISYTYFSIENREINIKEIVKLFKDKYIESDENIKKYFKSIYDNNI